MCKLVSIITPCYNGEKYIGRFMDAVLNQSYPAIELFVVNDGSTDRTEEVILGYKERFEQKGYQLNYIHQENGGQSTAINKALPLFKGDYLTWPDSDDYLPPTAIATKVEFMEQHPDCGACLCKTRVISDETGKQIGVQQRIPPKGEDRFFWDLIDGKNVYYSPGGYMVRSSEFRQWMPEPIQILAPREIGQNFQLLLPLVYHCKMGYIDEFLYCYTVRTNSHSHTKHNFAETMHIVDVSEQTLKAIAAQIESADDKRQIIDRHIDARMAKSRLAAMQKFDVTEGLDAMIDTLKRLDCYGWWERLEVFALHHPRLKKLAKKCKGMFK